TRSRPPWPSRSAGRSSSTPSSTTPPTRPRSSGASPPGSTCAGSRSWPLPWPTTTTASTWPPPGRPPPHRPRARSDVEFLHLVDNLPTLSSGKGRQENWAPPVDDVRAACQVAEDERLALLDGVRQQVL